MVDSLSQLEERVEMLIDHLRHMRDEIDQLRDQNTKLNSEIDRLGEENDTLRSQAKSTDKELKATSGKEEQIRDGLQGILEKLNTIEEEINLTSPVE